MEAYVGEYGSGKSENAINRALMLVREGRRVTLVDLDVVEPFWTLRPLKQELESYGLEVLAWERAAVEGFGEVGTLLNPAARWALKREGDVIIDVGYGAGGARMLNLLEGFDTDPDLKVLAVINAAKPMTSTVEEIVEHVRSLGRVDGLINNTHLGSETDVETVQRGARLVAEAARILGIPVVATSALEEIARLIGPRDCMGHPVRPLKRFMPRGFW
ncbi:hypothetical protein [Ammonifex thiophilus]|uniref:ATP-binding protein n=1 Tax=Ammonifex thiophilus TaxID=444093 RepID=A0A3D8P5I9_9THEO|nr:hypothetical protein [Ammonifex thiophilus]RDV84600.1 hypothetical protein DXX99_00705 [Ammonifex thiophilus]